MVFGKKKPEFSREELEGMLKEQDAKEKKDHVQYEEPVEVFGDEIDLVEDIAPPQLEQNKPQRKVPPKAKVISQTQANKLIDEENETGDGFKELPLEQQAEKLEEYQRLHRLKILFYEYNEMIKEYGSD